jgi:hypothetical protein
MFASDHTFAGEIRSPDFDFLFGDKRVVPKGKGLMAQEARSTAQ